MPPSINFSIFSPASFKSLAMDTYLVWKRSRSLLLGAALSFYAVISLPSMLVVIIAIAGAFMGKEDVQRALIEKAEELMGSSGSSTVEVLVNSASLASLSSFSTIIGALVLLWVATTVFSQLQMALNAIWEVPPPVKHGIKSYIRRRLIAFVIVVGMGFLVLAALIVSAFVAALERVLERPFDSLSLLVQLSDVVVTVGIVAVLLAFTYKVLPAADVSFRDVIPGAAITALLFAVGKFFISVYLVRTNLASAYGAASSLVILLLWIYYSALIFFAGAVFTRVYSDQPKPP